MCGQIIYISASVLISIEYNLTEKPIEFLPFLGFFTKSNLYLIL